MKKLSILIALMFVLSISKAQTIPNASFENWTNFGAYSNPNSYFTMNSAVNFLGNGNYTTEQGSPGVVGSYFLKLSVKNNGDPMLNSGWAVCDSLYNGMLQPGFAYNSRPSNFTGKWQYLVSPNDTSEVSVVFFKWNANNMTSEIIGVGLELLQTGSITNWTNFSIPINYLSAAIPDSALIILAAGAVNNPIIGDYLYIDDLAFSGNVPATINEVTEDIKFSIAPNPFDHYTTIHFSELQTNTAIQIIDILGNTIRNEQFNGNKFIIERGSLRAGIYFVQIKDKMNHIINKKIAIQ